MDDVTSTTRRPRRWRRGLATMVATTTLAATMVAGGSETTAVEALDVVTVEVTSPDPAPTLLAEVPLPAWLDEASASPHGTVVVEGTELGSRLLFTPTPGSFGLTTVSYLECVPFVKESCTARQVVVDVVDGIDEPDPEPVGPSLVLGDDAATATAGVPVVIDVLANDEGVEGASLAVAQAPTKGTATVEDGAVRYLADADASGEDSFTYRVCLPTPELLVAELPVRLLRTLEQVDVVEPLCATALATIAVTAAPDGGDEPGDQAPPVEVPVTPPPVDPAPQPRTVTSGDGSGPTREHPVVAAVTSPNGDVASIELVEVPVDLADGVFDFGVAFDVSVAPGTVEEPLVLEFRLHAERYGIADASPLVIRRNGVDVPACTAPGAAPDPCVELQVVEGGDVVVRVRSSQASRWTLALPATHCPETGASVACMVDKGVLRGRFGGAVLPEDAITAGQLASVVHRSLALAGADLPVGVDAFVDDAGSVHEAAINALVAADVLSGTGRDTYEPHRAVTWSEVADVLVRAHRRLGLALPAGFDPSGSALDLVVALGLVEVPADGPLDPAAVVSRRLVAHAVARLLDLDLVARLAG